MHTTPLKFSLLRTIPHIKNSFTQGLVIFDEDIIESGGRYGQSFLARYKINSLKNKTVLWKENLNHRYFAEGLTVYDNKIYLLTWKSQTAFVFDVATHQLLNSYSYQGEGWGLTHNNHELIRSDGSSHLYFHESKTFKQLRTLQVLEQGRPVPQINELEYAKGLIWANIWKQNRIIAISPETGEVVANADLSALVKQQHLTDPNAVLNGIAYDQKEEGFWVTGKHWKSLYLLQFEWPDK